MIPQKTPPLIYKQFSPSVVIVKSLINHNDPFSNGHFKDHVSGAGTGIVLDTGGNVLTNRHVVSDSDGITIGDKKAHVVAVDSKRDIAIIALDDALLDAPPIKICQDLSQLEIGDPVAALGNPFGLGVSMTTGIISGLDREGHMIQTDASINPGNSGGPLIDILRECVVGVNTSMMGPGVGFAIPIDDVLDSVNYATGFTERPDVLGLVLMPDDMAKDWGLPGVAVIDVVKGSLAESIGIVGTSRDSTGRPVFGDIILQANGRRVEKTADLMAALDQSPLDIDIVMIHGDGERTIHINRHITPRQ
jgi:S1-C subfamily serine protease